MKNAAISLLLLLTLAACSLGPDKKDAPAMYDFGAAPASSPAQPRIRASVLVYAVSAPSWLDSNLIVYRLNYQDGARQQTYANSRWAAPAPALITERLRARLAATSDGGIIGVADSARAEYALRVELEDFSQVFDTAGTSRAVVVARATIVDVARRKLHAQKTFTLEKPAAAPNAEGGVRALADASSELVDAIVAWTTASLARDRK
ncbi:MAG: ABC-type transport auxiliary lipoprotein family protein [Burkholderiales bacterium]